MQYQKRSIFALTKIKWPIRLVVRTQDFHSCNRGSIPYRLQVFVKIILVIKRFLYLCKSFKKLWQIINQLLKELDKTTLGD